MGRRRSLSLRDRLVSFLPDEGGEPNRKGEDGGLLVLYDTSMDAIGARLLAARIAAGVRIGSVIELVSDTDTELRPGDRGVVRGIDADGEVVVEWDRGFERTINPRFASYRALPA